MRMPNVISNPSVLMENLKDMTQNGLDIAADDLDMLAGYFDRNGLGIIKAAGDYKFEAEIWEKIGQAMLVGGMKGLSNLLHSEQDMPGDVKNNVYNIVNVFIQNNYIIPEHMLENDFANIEHEM